MSSLSSRTKTFTDSVIRRMTRVCLKYNAVNLSQGFPDWEPPKAVTDRLAKVAHSGPHQYAVTWGAANFRQALAKKQKHFTGLSVDPEQEIVTTCGGTEAMMVAVMSVADPGDKVVIFSPFYENYGADAILCGAEPIYVPLVPPAYGFDPDVLEAAFRQRPKAMILCNPSNPSGKVFTRKELQMIADLAERYDVWVITDEVYEHILYDPFEMVYFSTLPKMRERTITCGSLSKTYSITGWRLGYVIAPPHVIEVARKVHDFLTVGAAAPLQEAAVTALEFDDSYYAWLKAHYTKRRNLLVDGLRRIGLSHTEPQGAYYIMVDISAFGYASDTEFCEALAEFVGVGAVPGSAFFHEPITHYMRLHFAKNEATLNDALTRLSDIRKKMPHRRNPHLT